MDLQTSLNVNIRGARVQRILAIACFMLAGALVMASLLRATGANNLSFTYPANEATASKT